MNIFIFIIKFEEYLFFKKIKISDENYEKLFYYFQY
jgi:hypothetical protein